MASIIAFAINKILFDKIPLRLTKPGIVLPAVFLIVWYIFTQVIKYLVVVDLDILYAFLITLPVLMAIYLRLRKRKLVIGRVFVLSILLLFLAGLCIRQGTLIYQGLVLPGTYLKDYNREITQLIDKNAVVTGPYAPAFTIDNELKGIIYIFGLANIEKDLFSRFPITHILTDVGNWNLAPKEYPFLRDAFSVRRMKVRDGTVEIFRLPGSKVALSDYERAGVAFLEKKYDSVLIYSERFTAAYPDNLSGRFGLMTAHFGVGDMPKFLKSISSLLAEYPDNFRAFMFARYCYQLLYQSSGDETYNRLAENCFRAARKINPTLRP
jgi:hypothetical protein